MCSIVLPVGSWTRSHRYLLVAAALVVMVMPFLHERDEGFLLDRGVGIEAAQVQLVLEAPHAQSVVVVGDWNGWNVHADRLAKADDGDTWSIEMELERGKEYRYQFVIDGDQWIPDPHAYMQVDDGFGGMISVLEM
jgi:1,4-alpha-glucan branching enzyme